MSAALALYAALLAGDVPTDVRVRKLAPYFAPPPGAPLQVEERELRDLGPQLRAKKLKPERLRGFITVTPPKGQCFTLTRRKDEPDDVICKKTPVAYALGDLDREGHLNWRVVTGEGDFGTDLSWPSSIRVGIVEPFDAKDDAPPVYKFIRTCTPKRDGVLGRRIELALLSGETWILRFPAEDELLPQPDPLPNLYMYQAGGKISVKEASEHGSEAPPAEGGEHGEAKPEAGGHGEEKAEAGGEHGEAAKPAEPPKKKVYQEDDRAEWAIPIRDAYGMPATAFIANGTVAPGLQGSCRYIYKGTDRDPTTGRVECHHVDGYRLVYLPVACIADIRPRKD